jgi:thiol-disulfide isomerase/thioredoxin
MVNFINKMIIKLFTKIDCPRCPAAKEVVAKVEKKVKVEKYDVDTIEGMAEAAFYTVMATPTVLVCDDLGKEVAGFRGEVPKLGELEKVLSK